MKDTCMSRANILIVNDNISESEKLKSSLESNDYKVFTAVSSEKAVNIFEKYKSDLIIIDLTQNDEFSEIVTATEIHNTYGIPILFLTSSSNPDIFRNALTAEPFGYITKPYTNNQILISIEISLYHAHKENDQQKAIQELLGKIEKKQLDRLLPICSHCKKIRDEDGLWHEIEDFFNDLLEVNFTHSICADCLIKHYPELDEE